MAIEIDEFKSHALEKLCEYAPFSITIFEKDGYCTICPKDCYYAKQNTDDKKVQCTKKGYSFLDEDLRHKTFLPKIV